MAANTFGQRRLLIAVDLVVLLTAIAIASGRCSDLAMGFS